MDVSSERLSSSSLLFGSLRLLINQGNNTFASSPCSHGIPNGKQIRNGGLMLKAIYLVLEAVGGRKLNP
jgi:hypothetical protein